MKVFNLTAHGQSHKVTVHLHNYYQNNRLAIQLNDAEDGRPYAVATVNKPEVLLADNEVLVKDYSENEGMLDFLVKHNIVTPTQNGVQSGHVWLPVAIVNDESVWGEVPNAYCMDEEPEYNQLDPAPDEINTDTGKMMWKIKGYKIWADSYKQAQELLPMIESF